MTNRSVFSAAAAGVALACGLLAASPAHALFSDDEARKAILELRQRVEAQRAAQDRLAEEVRKASDENTMIRRSLLDLQNQIEMLRADLARTRGTEEQVMRALAEIQQRQKDLAQGVETRLSRFEPTTVTVDGVEFTADPAEKREFEAALATFRKGEFVTAQPAFAEFLKRHPQSGYAPSALFWLGNAQYANRDYQGAIASFRALLTRAPDHQRAPEAVLSIANCQIELKDTRAARRTLDDLVKAYPQSEAATAARERLSRLR